MYSIAKHYLKQINLITSITAIFDGKTAFMCESMVSSSKTLLLIGVFLPFLLNKSVSKWKLCFHLATMVSSWGFCMLYEPECPPFGDQKATPTTGSY